MFLCLDSCLFSKWELILWLDIPPGGVRWMEPNNMYTWCRCTQARYLSMIPFSVRYLGRLFVWHLMHCVPPVALKQACLNAGFFPSPSFSAIPQAPHTYLLADSIVEVSQQHREHLVDLDILQTKGCFQTYTGHQPIGSACIQGETPS